jgi:hypothetical protein
MVMVSPGVKDMVHSKDTWRKMISSPGMTWLLNVKANALKAPIGVASCVKSDNGVISPSMLKENCVTNLPMLDKGTPTTGSRMPAEDGTTRYIVAFSAISRVEVKIS